METNYMNLELPSKCLVYGDVKPEQIQIRTLKGKDEKLIAELNYDNVEKKFLALLKNILRGIDPEELTIGDRMHIMLWEVINSYSKIYPVNLTCDICLNNVQIDADLSRLEVEELPNDFKEPHEIKLSNGDTVNLRLFRVKDQIRVEDYEKNRKNSWLYRFALTMIDDKDVFARVNYLENLGVKDLAKIRAFHEKYFHGPDMKYKYECPECGEEGEVVLPFRLEFIFPYGEILAKYFGDGV